jgi:hypothetical protein
MERALVNFLREEAAALEVQGKRLNSYTADLIINLEAWASNVERAINVDERAHARRAMAVSTLFNIASAMERAEGIPNPDETTLFLLKEQASNVRYVLKLLAGEE